MGFSGTFREPFVTPVFSAGGGVTPWYLSGNVPLANCIAAYQPKNSVSLAASYVNLAHPGTNDAAPGTAPTWDVTNGWIFAAVSSQYLKTGIVPTGSYSMIVQFTNRSGTGGRIGSGVAGGNNFFYLMFDNGGGNHTYGDGNEQVSVAGTIASGNVALCGVTAGYKNGALDKSLAGTFSGTGLAIYISARNQDDVTPVNFMTVDIQAFAVYNITLSSTQVGLIAAAMAAL